MAATTSVTGVNMRSEGLVDVEVLAGFRSGECESGSQTARRWTRAAR